MTLQEKLNYIQTEGGSVKYNFENGSSLNQNINKEVFFDIKGKRRTSEDILNVFKSIAHDIGAVSLEF